MSDGSGADQSTRKKVRLLTFDWLPFTDDFSASESVFDAMDCVSASAVFFENHYLQKAGAAGIVPVSVDSSHAGNTQLSGRLLAYGNALARRSIDFAALPEALLGEVRGPLPHGSSVLQEDIAKTIGDDFCWMHFESDDTNQPDDVFSLVLSNIPLLLDQQNVVIITALSGRPGNSTRFETLLPESLIRAPLWILGTQLPGRRIQTVTGSRDVAVTIDALINGALPDWPANNSAGSLPINLLSLAVQPGRSIDRELLIECPHARAVRSSEFLYVNREESPDSEFNQHDTALYAKPEDVWNVNDVSGEYHAIVDDLARRLD